MLSFKEQGLLNLILRTACIMQLFPHNWCTISNRLIVTKSLRKIILVQANCLVSLLYTVFLAVRLRPGYVYSRTELKYLTFELMVHYFWISVQFTCFVIQVFSLQHKHDFAILVNQLTSFNQKSGIKV